MRPKLGRDEGWADRQRTPNFPLSTHYIFLLLSWSWTTSYTISQTSQDQNQPCVVFRGSECIVHRAYCEHFCTSSCGHPDRSCQYAQYGNTWIREYGTTLNGWTGHSLAPLSGCNPRPKPPRNPPLQCENQQHKIRCVHGALGFEGQHAEDMFTIHFHSF